MASIAAALMLLSCGPYQPPPQAPIVPFPTSPWGGTYQYSYDPPEQSEAASVPVTIIVVNPHYEVLDSALMDPLYSKVGRGFSVSMGIDLDKILIAKGMTVKGPASSLEDITYSDKEGSDLTLFPSVFITTEIKYLDEWHTVNEGTTDVRMERQFQIIVGGWISFTMHEPLSEEKMWIKKLDVEETIAAGFECSAAVPQYTPQTGFFGQQTGQTLTGYTAGDVTYDGKPDAVANVLKKIYPSILSKFWTYIDTNELLVLKDKVKEIRILKRY